MSERDFHTRYHLLHTHQERLRVQDEDASFGNQTTDLLTLLCLMSRCSFSINSVCLPQHWTNRHTHTLFTDTPGLQWDVFQVFPSRLLVPSSHSLPRPSSLLSAAPFVNLRPCCYPQHTLSFPHPCLFFSPSWPELFFPSGIFFSSNSLTL